MWSSAETYSGMGGTPSTVRSIGRHRRAHMRTTHPGWFCREMGTAISGDGRFLLMSTSGHAGRVALYLQCVVLRLSSTALQHGAPRLRPCCAIMSTLQRVVATRRAVLCCASTCR